MKKFVLLATLLLFATSAQAGKMTVLLDWFVNPDHAPLFVAQEKGFFKARGLDVEFIAPSNPNDPPKLVAAGQADVAVSYQHQHQMQVAEGLPLVRFATLVDTPLNCLVVLKDGPVKSIADLKGRTVGYSVGGFETALLKVMLEKEGLALDDVKLVNVNFSLAPSLLSGQADAVIGAFRNFELNQMDIEGHPGRAFFVEEHGVPPYDELILVTSAKNVKNPDLRKFTDALAEGAQYLTAHPDECWKLFIAGDRASLDDELNRRAWRDTLPRFAQHPGALDKARYARFAEFMKEQKLVDRIPEMSDWAVEMP